MDDHELLVRIDERLEALLEWKIEKNKECSSHIARTTELEAWKNRIVGVTIGAGAVAGAMAALLYNIASKLLFRG